VIKNNNFNIVRLPDKIILKIVKYLDINDYNKFKISIVKYHQIFIYLSNMEEDFFRREIFRMYFTSDLDYYWYKFINIIFYFLFILFFLSGSEYADNEDF